MNGRRRAVLYRVTFPLLAAVYFVVPSAIQIASAQTSKSHGPSDPRVARATTPIPVFPAGELATYRAFSSQPVLADAPPIIITFHAISERPGDYTVSPSQFAGMMAMLDAAGYHAIGTEDLLAYLGGKSLAPRSVMITFDDGITSSLRYADSVLAQHHFRAVEFVITGFVGTHRPYYLTWAELTTLAKTGRWEMEAHTRNGHVNIPTGPNGSTAPFLNNLEWLIGQNRFESSDEYAARIRTDLQGGIQDLIDHGFPKPKLFAYPFSATSRLSTSAASKAAASRFLEPDVASLFSASFTDDQSPHANGQTQFTIRELNRVDVSVAPTPRELFNRIAKVTPEPLVTHPFDRPSAWLLQRDNARECSEVPPQPTFSAGRLDLKPGRANTASVIFDPDRTLLWSRYHVSVTVLGLATAGDSVTGYLRALEGTANATEVGVSSGRVQVANASGNLFNHPIAAASAHVMELDVGLDTVIVTVDGQRLVSVPVAGVGGRPPSGSIELGTDRGHAADPVTHFADLTVGASTQ